MNIDYVITLAKDIHDNENKKWWTDKHGKYISIPIYQVSMLITSELAEAMEGIRKNLNDDKLPHRKMFEVEMADTFIRLMDAMMGYSVNASVYIPTDVSEVINMGEVEFLEHINREVSNLFNPNDIKYLHMVNYLKILDKIHFYMGIKNYQLITTVLEKRAFNKIRTDHSNSEREKENGKKF